jgi:hypothetical protein
MVWFQVVILIEIGLNVLLEPGFDSNSKIRIQGEFLSFKVSSCGLCFLFFVYQLFFNKNTLVFFSSLFPFYL